jgi:beta-phosphoglucomutase-like phosphatase (HAD superfamily)
VDRSQDILAVIATWEPARRAEAHALIHEIEAEALSRMTLMRGAAALGAWCAARGVPMGLVTRNTAASVAHLHAHHWTPSLALRPFSPAVARDDGLRHKPHPDALLRCATAWGVPPESCVMIGDSPRDDVVAGRAAGMHTILLLGDAGRHGAGAAAAAAALEGERVPHATALSMEDVPALLEAAFRVPPPLVV